MYHDTKEIGAASAIAYGGLMIVLAELMPKQQVDATQLLSRANGKMSDFMRISGVSARRASDTGTELRLLITVGRLNLEDGGFGWWISLTAGGMESVEEFCSEWGYCPLWLRTEASSSSPFL